jgi:hypothetical protein
MLAVSERVVWRQADDGNESKWGLKCSLYTVVKVHAPRMYC